MYIGLVTIRSFRVQPKFISELCEKVRLIWLLYFCVTYFYQGGLQHRGLTFAAEWLPVAGADIGPHRVCDRVHLHHGRHPHGSDWTSESGSACQLQVYACNIQTHSYKWHH